MNSTLNTPKMEVYEFVPDDPENKGIASAHIVDTISQRTDQIGDDLIEILCSYDPDLCRDEP